MARCLYLKMRSAQHNRYVARWRLRQQQHRYGGRGIVIAASAAASHHGGGVSSGNGGACSGMASGAHIGKGMAWQRK